MTQTLYAHMNKIKIKMGGREGGREEGRKEGKMTN
jgi:hypothetical protein